MTNGSAKDVLKYINFILLRLFMPFLSVLQIVSMFTKVIDYLNIFASECSNIGLMTALY